MPFAGFLVLLDFLVCVWFELGFFFGWLVVFRPVWCGGLLLVHASVAYFFLGGSSFFAVFRLFFVLVMFGFFVFCFLWRFSCCWFFDLDCFFFVASLGWLLPACVWGVCFVLGCGYGLVFLARFFWGVGLLVLGCGFDFVWVMFGFVLLLWFLFFGPRGLLVLFLCLLCLRFVACWVMCCVLGSGFSALLLVFLGWLLVVAILALFFAVDLVFWGLGVVLRWFSVLLDFSLFFFWGAGRSGCFCYFLGCVFLLLCLWVLILCFGKFSGSWFWFACLSLLWVWVLCVFLSFFCGLRAFLWPRFRFCSWEVGAWGFLSFFITRSASLGGRLFLGWFRCLCCVSCLVFGSVFCLFFLSSCVL